MCLYINQRLNIFALLVFISPIFSGTLSANEKPKNTSVINDPSSSAFKDIGSGLSNISLSGLVKVDVIYDMGQPSGDRINYSNISTDGSEKEGQARIHARESRIGAKYIQGINGKNLTAFIEGDFYGGGTNSPTGSEKISNASDFRLRHAYISYNNWIVGQTWSNYIDVKSFPETLDFSNATGQAFIRQGQIRYQHKMNNVLFSYSLENPETDVYIPEDYTDVETIDPIVDLTVKAKYESSWGHFSLQLVARKQKVYKDSTSISDTSYGVGSAGKIYITPRDVLTYHYSQGDGIGRYIQEVSGASGLVSESGNREFSLSSIKAKGGYVGYQHRFKNALRANLNSGFIDIDYSSMSDALVADKTKNIISIHGNLIWPVNSNIDIGFEHSIVKLKTVAGDTGSLKRFQLSTTLRF